MHQLIEQVYIPTTFAILTSISMQIHKDKRDNTVELGYYVPLLEAEKSPYYP